MRAPIGEPPLTVGKSRVSWVSDRAWVLTDTGYIQTFRASKHGSIERAIQAAMKAAHELNQQPKDQSNE